MTDKRNRRKSFSEWWEDRIKTLTELDPSPEEILDEVKKKKSNVEKLIYTVDNAWPGIKLAIHAYYLDIYTVVARKNFGKLCYVDTFAGSGIISIKCADEKIFLYGSPLLSILVPRNGRQFDKYVFIDVNCNYTSILREAVRVLSKYGKVNENNVEIINMDMNKFSYRNLLREFDHALIFVDPEGLEPKWSTIMSILELRTDVLFNFMTAGIRRTWGYVKSKGKESEALTSFYGDDSWKHAENEEDLLRLYINKIKGLGRVVVPVRVRGSDLFYYDILTISRPTKGGNPWLKAVSDRLKPFIERTDSETFARLLDVFRGRINPLSFYC